MKDSMKAGVSVYHATPTKYIIFTVCAVILIRVLQDVLISLSSSDSVRENATKAIEHGKSAYKAYQDIRYGADYPVRQRL